MIKLDNNITEEELIKHLTNKELIIYEDIQGSRVYVKYTGDRFIIKPRSFRNEELNFVDLATQKFYNPIYFFFNTLPQYITNILNRNWWYCFEFLYDEFGSHTKYNKVPKNNLILTSIVKGNKHKFNYDEIVEYSNLFDVEPLPVIFKGELLPKQLEVIALFLKSSTEDLKFVFGNDNFAKFFYNILNINIENSFLMDDDFNDNLEKIIIRINGDDKFSFEVLNPLFKRNLSDNSTEYAQIFSLIIVNFLEFLQLKDIKKYKPKGLTKDEMYINLISIIFNEYMDNIKDDIKNWEISIPKFIKDDKFKINTNLVRNKITKEYVQSSEKIEYLFKIILGNFNKFRKKPMGLMTKSTIQLLNAKVEEINKHLEEHLKINRDYRFQQIDLLNFRDYFDLQWDKDGSGEIYPDVSVQFEAEPETDLSKKGKKGKFKKKW